MRRRDFLAAALLAGCAAPPKRTALWPTALTMGTGSTGGTYAVYGPAWGALAQAATGVNLAYRATQGPNQNILLLDRSAVQLGMSTTAVARQAWEGEGAWTQGTKLRSIRALFPMYSTPFHAVARADSGIVRLAQFSGRVIGIGEEGGTSGTFAPAMLATLGIRPRQIRFGGIGDQVAQVASGVLDASIVAAGAPVPAIAAEETRTDLRIIGFSRREVEQLREAMPDLSAGELPRGTYRTLRSPLPVVTTFNIALCRADLPDDLAEAIVAAVMAGHADLVARAPVAAETIAANAGRNTAVPYHAGAEAYFVRNRVALPRVG
ncbi:MAG: TAXI family TRAP transporter solute-binding subunit [Proteobacteria bacterium]|nr:TAXI family TRAP transporter solute-binding subunit [Pseudomonadota bacterium]